MSPDPKHVTMVEQWASDHGATGLSFSECKEFATIRMPSARIPAAFAKSMRTTCSALGCSRSIAVPPSLSPAVDFIDGLGGAFESSAQLVGGRDHNPQRRRNNKTGSKSLTAVSKPGPWYPKCLALSADPGPSSPPGLERHNSAIC